MLRGVPDDRDDNDAEEEFVHSEGRDGDLYRAYEDFTHDGDESGGAPQDQKGEPPAPCSLFLLLTPGVEDVAMGVKTEEEATDVGDDEKHRDRDAHGGYGLPRDIRPRGEKQH